MKNYYLLVTPLYLLLPLLIHAQPIQPILGPTLSDSTTAAQHQAARQAAKPDLTFFFTQKSVYCLSEPVSVSYTATGDFDAINKLSFYLVDLNTQPSQKTLLQETTALSGSFSFSLNALPLAGSYMLECRASSPALTFSQTPVFFVQKPVSLSLAPVSKAIYKNYYEQLTLNTTDGGTFSYKLATPGSVQSYSVTMPFGGTTNTILIPITESGSYSLVDVSSQCGRGYVSGVASVTILPKSEVMIFPRMPNTLDGTYCTGQSYLVTMQTTGSFGSDNVFTAYIADSLGRVFRSLPIAPIKEYLGNILYVYLPNDLPDGDRFVFRVGSSNPAHLGASLANPRSSESVNLLIRHVPTATLTSTLAVFKGDSAQVSVALTGPPGD